MGGKKAKYLFFLQIFDKFQINIFFKIKKIVHPLQVSGFISLPADVSQPLAGLFYSHRNFNSCGLCAEVRQIQLVRT